MKTNIRRFQLLFFPAALLVVGVLTGCQPYYAPPPQPHHPAPVAYVSAHHDQPLDKPYTHQEDNTKEYISAWLEAQMEDTAPAMSAGHDPDPMRAMTPSSGPARSVGGGGGPELSGLWGRPPGAVSEGVTLLHDDDRRRLNDALERTPVTGRAEWDRAGLTFVFRPNSAVYQPYHSGGFCRDGIFIAYSQRGEERVRGLFCQPGRGADWALVGGR